MAVLIEGTSVVFPRKLTNDKYQGGWPQLLEDRPRAGFINDGELLCFSFFPSEDTMQHVGDFLSLLEDRGLTIASEGKFIDVAVIDQLQDYPDGYSCDWLTVYQATLNLEKPQYERFGNFPGLEEEEGEGEEAEGAEAAEGEADAAADETIKAEIASDSPSVEAAETAEMAENAEASGSEKSGELTEEEIAKLPKVKAVRLVGGLSKGVNMPADWDYDRSLTKEFGIVRPEVPFTPQA